jgi:hypothetical protein
MTCNTTQYVNDAYQCSLDGATAQFNELQFALLVALIVGGPLYVKFEDPIPVGSAVALIGGVMIPTLPGQASMIAWMVVFIGLVVAVFGAAYKGMVR